MKSIRICVSTQLLLLLTIPLALLLSTVGGCAEAPSAPNSRVSAVAASDPISKWVGVYDSAGGACSAYPVTISESTFSWGDCKNVKIHVIAVSDTELAFEVDPNGKCGWAGWIVAMTTSLAEARVVDVNAYSGLIKYEAKEHYLSCDYSKRIVK